MRSEFENIVEHIARWHTKWGHGAIFCEAADSFSVKPIWRIYATSRRDYFDFKVIVSKILNSTGSLNIYTQQDTYLSVFQNNPNQISERRFVFSLPILMKGGDSVSNRSKLSNIVKEL